MSLLLLAGMTAPGWLPYVGLDDPVPPPPPPPQPLVAPPKPVAKKAALPDPQPPAVDEVLRSGVLIVISKATQQMHVFKDGELWDTSPVSTGRRGHTTPAGVFPILQKQEFHRSNLYSNAPMPFMQRLTWGGIAIHAGRLPGYAASHGCIRVPHGFAKALYGLTRADRTTVVIANEAIASQDHARSFALALKMPPRPDSALPLPQPPALAGPPPPPPPPAYSSPAFVEQVVPRPVVTVARAEPSPPTGQTIQLAASASPAEAEAQWARLLAARPELARFRKVVVPAVVGSRQVFRLRVSAPDAHAFCARLKSAGLDCFKVS